jgi:hypothetical protein
VLTASDCQYSLPVLLAYALHVLDQVRVWIDSVGHQYASSGSQENADTLKSFYNGFDLGEVTRVRVAADPATAMRRLGVIGTPSLPRGRGGRLRFGILGDHLPPTSIAKTVCM